MDSPRHYKSHPGKRPVSCRFCRTRKLRCNRVSPCSNCVERDLPCELQPVKIRPKDQSRDELLERIGKLEALLAQQQNNVVQLPAQPIAGSSAGYDQPVTQPGGPQVFGTTSRSYGQATARAIDFSENTLPFSAAQRPTPATVTSLDDEVAHLERIYIDKDISIVNIPTPKIIFKICRMRDIINGTTLRTAVENDTRCVWLPEYQEAKTCVQKFRADIEHVHYVYHSPSIPSIIDELYVSLNENTHIELGHVLLLLGIIVSSIHSWSQYDQERSGLFANAGETSRQTAVFLRYLEDVLEIGQRKNIISIEGLQGLVIASFVLCNFEGFSRRSRAWYSTCLLLARELGLHSIDRPGNPKFMTYKQAEIGRRVWWYLVASDWMLATRFAGIAQGSYSCHVRQMMTRKPLNIDDEDLHDSHVPVEKPMSQPTTMSYCLQRLRLTEICRKSVDLAPLIMAHTGASSYEIVLDIDTEIQTLLNELPPYFSMSPTDIVRTYNLSPTRASQLHHNGYMIRQLIAAQRCALHLTYLIRSYVDNTYAPSRAICLATAKTVIATETALENPLPDFTIGGSPSWPAGRYKFLGLLMVVFLSSVILLVDQCQHKRTERSPELDAAIVLLEKARGETPTAARFLTQLMDVLQRHKRGAAGINANTNINISQQPSIPPAFTTSLSSASQPNLSSCPQIFPATGLHTPPSSLSAANGGTAPPSGIFFEPPLPASTNAAGTDLMDMDVSTFFDEFAHTLQDGGFGIETGDVGGVDWEWMLMGLEGGVG